MKLTIGVMGSSGGHLSAEATDKAHRLGTELAWDVSVPAYLERAELE